jgi:pimeloyl-ACP methyl ester carboxylesterase
MSLIDRHFVCLLEKGEVLRERSHEKGLEASNTTDEERGKMAMDTVSTGGLMEVNGAEIYHEVRGSGPSVLFIAGATGDAGHFRRVAEILSDEFTVVTYDRRANSRSPRPDGWESASTEEQSDDAAGLIEALGIGPAAVFGNSAGAIIGLDLVIRHPGSVRGAILHEPPMTAGMSDPEGVMGAIQRVVEGGMQDGGPRGGCEAFFRFVAGDEVFEKLDPQLRARMLANGETFFGPEMGVFESYRPDEVALEAIEVPVRVMVGTESAPFFVEVGRWLADGMNVELEELSGAHTPYFDRPQRMAETLRPLLREMSKQPV